MTWKKGLITLVAILGFYVLVKMLTRNIFSAADLQNIYTDALAKRQQQIEQRYRKATVRIAEINAALILASLESAKRTEALKKNWEKTLNETKLTNKKDLEKANASKEVLYFEMEKRDTIILEAKGTIDKITKEFLDYRSQVSTNLISLDSAWKEKLKIVEEDRDFWNKESKRWNKKYLKERKWRVYIGAISFGLGVFGRSQFK